MAAFQGCLCHAKPEQVEKVSEESKVSYAEALRRDEGGSNSSQIAEPGWQ